jgi:hypothetical protein
MSGFKTDLWVKPEPDGKTWEIVSHDFIYECEDGTVITVPVGTVTDFASTPREIWACYPPWGSYGFGAVVHDFLYQTQPFSKDRADLIFLEAMKAHGVDEFTREIIFHAVSVFGWVAWDAHARDIERQKANHQSIPATQ